MLSLPHLPPRDDLWASSPFRHNLSPSIQPNTHGQGNYSHGSSGAGPHSGTLPTMPGFAPASFLPADTATNPLSVLPNGAMAPSHMLNNQQHHLPTHMTRFGASSGHATPLTLQGLSLASVTSDEKSLQQRKRNVMQFGSSWIKPPGVMKTFAARQEEDMERREQLEAARQQANMDQLLRAQQQEGQDGIAGGTGQGDEIAEERDLDADIPDADVQSTGHSDDDDNDDGDDDDEDDEDDVDENNGEEGEESFLEASFVGGDGDATTTRSFLEAEDAELDGRAQDRRDLGVESRDLDDEIPEASNWEHTDTEEEDDTDEDDNVQTGDRMVVEQGPPTSTQGSRTVGGARGIFASARRSWRASFASSSRYEDDGAESDGPGSPLGRSAIRLFGRQNR